MITTLDLAGYFASTMVLLTFLTKDMRLLRVLAIVSNIGFVTYGLLAWLPPVFCLHLLLLPVNALRLHEMLKAQGASFANIAKARQLLRHGQTALWTFSQVSPRRSSPKFGSSPQAAS